MSWKVGGNFSDVSHCDGDSRNWACFCSDRNQAIFILILTAMVWTLIASWQLQRTLIDFAKFETSRNDLGFEEDIDIAYSDDEESSDLLKDESIGLRGRPDQIVIVDGEFIPVEQKTGRVPHKPYDSHKMLCWLTFIWCPLVPIANTIWSP